MTDSPRILLVDDDDDDADAMVRRERPDLVLMDVIMEERTAGFFALHEIRRDPAIAATPVFVVSSIYSQIPGFRVSPDAGWLPHDGFLAKPVDLDDLLARLQARLGDPPARIEARLGTTAALGGGQGEGR